MGWIDNLALENIRVEQIPDRVKQGFQVGHREQSHFFGELSNILAVEYALFRLLIWHEASR